MSLVFLSGLPGPPDGEQWCTACVMFAKGNIDAELQEQYEVLNKDGKDEHKWLAAPLRGYPLQIAVVYGLCAELMQLGILHLCWTHLAGFKVKPKRQVATADELIAPGLLKGTR